ncbi:hypothetical protein JMA_27290 [Jeotgalibacillus malaysiensis]|uniref:Uncharacterized protein n=1 Tax=Jeotgalibacillus malaysiensis TaxID=1508404 RepID=A0A0B5APL8_9BACL|nr:hypothetical protein [Jeotgalibacillus malaysiensis]AJD92046.1 hypothetical protein JMA_27290 [Jeotgalibacillus malaysiensis]
MISEEILNKFSRENFPIYHFLFPEVTNGFADYFELKLHESIGGDGKFMTNLEDKCYQVELERRKEK